MQETAKEQESLVVKNQRAEEYSSSKKNISHVIEGRRGGPEKVSWKQEKWSARGRQEIHEIEKLGFW